MGWYDLPENNTGALCARLSGDAAKIQVTYKQFYSRKKLKNARYKYDFLVLFLMVTSQVNIEHFSKM